MKVDADLMFACLMHINLHYYPVFGLTEACMTTAKFLSDKRDTPDIDKDAAVCFSRLFGEFVKLLVFYRYMDKRIKLATSFAVFMSFGTLGTVYYTVMIQDPTIKLEYVLATLTTMLLITEVVFGFWSLMPCYKKLDYY